MKNCPSCGIELADEAKFCSECGKSSEKTKKFCQNCGSELENEAKFCIECGTASYISSEDECSEACGQVPVEITEAPNSSAPAKPNKINYILSLAFAIASMVCAALSADDFIKTLFVFLPSMIVFLILSKSFTRKYYQQADTENKFIKASRILTKIALPVGVVFACLSFVSGVVSILTSSAFTSFVEEIVTFFNDTVYELLAK